MDVTVETPPGRLRQRAALGLVWSGVEAWGRQFLSLVVFALLSRILDPAAFGLVALASVFLAFAEELLDLGFAAALIQRRELDPQDLDTAFWTGIAAALLIAGIGIALSGVIARLFHEARLGPVVVWLCAGLIPAALVNVQQALLRRSLEFRTLALRSLIAGSVGGIVAVVMAVLGFGVWSLVARTLVSALLGAAILWRATPWRPTARFSWTSARQLLGFGRYVLGTRLAYFVGRRSDDVMIGFFLGATQLGYYTIAYRILMVMIQLLSGVVDAVIFPALSALQSDRPRLLTTFYESTRLISAIAVPAFVGAAIVAPELVRVIFGPAWAPSTPVMRWLAFAGIVQVIYSSNGSVLFATGHPAWQLRLASLNAVLNAVVFAIAAPYGIVAVAAVYAARNYVTAPLPLIVLQRVVGVDLGRYLRALAAPAAATAVMALVLLAARGQLGGEARFGFPVEFAGAVVSAMLVYVVALRVLAPAFVARALASIRLALVR